MRRRSSTRLLLDVFVISILVNAALGIWALLAGDFGEIQEKVLSTSFMVSMAMLSVLVNIPAARRRVRWPAPVLGAAAAATGFAIFTVLMWADVEDEHWLKLAGSFLVVAGALTLSSSLALIGASQRWRWLGMVADVLIAALAVTILAGLWFEPDGDWYPRLLGVQAVLVAAVVLILPVLSRFVASQAESPAPLPGAGGVRYCPSCGQPVGPGAFGADEEVVCEGCGLTFAVIPAGGDGGQRDTDRP